MNSMKWVSLNPNISYDYFQNQTPVRSSNQTHLDAIAGTNSPWETDLGIRYCCDGYNSDDRDTFWNSKRIEQTSLKNLIADFYTLEAISCLALFNDALPEPRIRTYKDRDLITFLASKYGLKPANENLNNIALNALLYQTRLAQVAAPVLADYMHQVIILEASYHPGTWWLGQYPNNVVGWHKMREIHGGEQLANWASDLFNEPDKREGAATVWLPQFGGRSWAKASDVLASYHNGTLHGMDFGPREFLDRAFSLQHNTGTLFNKMTWRNQIRATEILEAHHNSDWSVLVHHASDPVKELVRSYASLLNEERRQIGLESISFKSGGWRSYETGDLCHEATISFDVENYPALRTGRPLVKQTCVITGKTIHTTDIAVWHGKSKGFSLYKEYCKFL